MKQRLASKKSNNKLGRVGLFTQHVHLYIINEIQDLQYMPLGLLYHSRVYKLFLLFAKHGAELSSLSTCFTCPP